MSCIDRTDHRADRRIDRGTDRRADQRTGHRADDIRAPRRAELLASLCLLLGLAACSSRSPAPVAPQATAPSTAPAAAPASPSVAPSATPAAPSAAAQRPPRNWDEYREQASRRIVSANAARSYMGVPPEPLLAIPVIEIELGPDGSVRSIKVLRPPRQALDTVQLAIDAVRRAGPFGSVAHLPQPWRFTEVFLFDDERRFKPRSLDR